MNNNDRKIPAHVGIIMDGNRRWAKERHLPVYEGHSKGFEKMRMVPAWFFSRGVAAVSLFAFSAENWNRPAEEINDFMKLLRQSADEMACLAEEKNYCLKFSGRIAELPGDLPQACLEAGDKTKDGKAGIINICLNYGGRMEIADAIKKMIKNKVEEDQVHEGMIKKYLYAGELDDPGLILRTSGEQRLSSFLLWEGAFSELVFLNKYWPEFEPTDVDYALNEFDKRKRGDGGD